MVGNINDLILALAVMVVIRLLKYGNKIAIVFSFIIDSFILSSRLQSISLKQPVIKILSSKSKKS